MSIFSSLSCYLGQADVGHLYFVFATLDNSQEVLFYVIHSLPSITLFGAMLHRQKACLVFAHT